MPRNDDSKTDVSVKEPVSPTDDSDTAGVGASKEPKMARAIERTATEASLLQSEQRYRTLFNSIDQGFCIIEMLFDDRGEASDYRFLEYNPMFEKLKGMRNVAGKTALEVFPDLERKWIDIYGKVAKTGRSMRFEDNSVPMNRYFEVHASPVDDGSKNNVALVFTNITERKLSEAALRESEERFRHVANAAPVLIWMADVTRDCTWFNNQWLEFTGKTIEQEIGDGWAADVHPDDNDRCVETYYQAFEAREPFSMEYRLLRHDGEFRWVFDTGTPRFAPGGEFLGFIGSCIDITERRNTEVTLRETQMRFELAQSAGNVGVWDWSAATEQTYWSDSMWEIYGLEPPAGGLTDELWKSMLAPEDRDRVGERIDQLLRSTELDYRDRFKIIRPDGSIRWLETIAKVSRAEDGRPLGVAGVNIDITERVQAEGLLDRYRLLSDQANDVIWFVRPDGAFVEVNRAAEDAYGYTREELLSMNVRDIRHPSKGKDVSGQLKAAHKGSVKFETIHMRKDGTAFPVEVSANVTRYGEEKLILAIVRDITERIRADEQIRQSEKRLRLVTNSMPALISYVDRNERYSFVNETYTEWFRAPSEEMVGKKIREVVGPMAYREIGPFIKQALSGEHVSFETTLHYKEAGTRFVHVSYAPDLADDGTVLGFYGLISDLSELKRSQDLLRSSEERLGVLMESFPDYAILSTDLEGNIVSWNSGAENIFGYKETEAVGQPIRIIFTPEDVANEVPAKEMRQARKNGRASDERWHLRKDGTRFFASGIMTPLFVGAELTGYAKILTDLTEKKRREDQLQFAHDELEVRVAARTKELAALNLSLRLEIEERKAAEKEKINLLKKVVTSQEEERRRIARDLHDQMGQRLTALRLKIASLADYVAEDEEVVERVARLQEIAERIDTEVSFLAWELRPSALDDLGLVEALRAYLKEWSRHYETEAEFHANAVLGKRLRREAETHLYRIAQEALHNIVKHAKATAVTVLLERQGNNLILIIEDNGAGFDVSKRGAMHKAGKGLGLIGMGERASLIWGEVEVESGVGKGTTIFVRVPIAGRGK